jgi:hypothetical protein
MELQSDFARIKDLLETEELTKIEFSDCSRRQFGGKHQSDWEITNLDDDEDYGEEDDWENTLKGGDNTDAKEEKDIYSIFSRARDYRTKLVNAPNGMMGGQEEGEKKKRKPNKTIMALLETSKELKASGKYDDIKWTDLMKVSKMIWDSAAKKLGTDDPDKITIKVKELVKKPDEYIERFRNQNKGSSAKSANSPSKRYSKSKRFF